MQVIFSSIHPLLIWKLCFDRLRAQRKQLKMKIIERKYFKQPQEPNLLTWEAKEQMRYLNSEFPEEWTVDRLAESFPVSREGVVRLLRSRWVPRNLQELLRHDRAVHRQWKALRQAGKAEGGPLLAHASGIAGLPKPEDTWLLEAGEERPTPGLFESMYLRSVGKARDDCRQDHDRVVRALEEHRRDNRKLLGAIGFKQTVPHEEQPRLRHSPAHAQSLLDGDVSLWDAKMERSDKLSSEPRLEQDAAELDPGLIGTRKLADDER